MHFDEYHNHKWAKNLSHARDLLREGDLETFYRGEDLPEGDVYPGMRVMAAYWVSVEHEMRMRLAMLLKGAKKPEWRQDVEIVAQKDAFLERFLDDMRMLIEREGIVTADAFEDLLAAGMELPENWREHMRGLQDASEAALEAGAFPEDLVEAWFASCLRSVANYNHYLIWGGVTAAALVKRRGNKALKDAIDATAREFMWEISREFYVNVMPSVGFEDIGDVMELGMRGMFSDQYYVTGEEREEGETVIKQSLLKNCELAGIYRRAAEWNDLPPLALGYGICRYCEAHGEATMMITMPPMYAPEYKLVQSIGLHDKTCAFQLKLVPADDMDRLMMVQEKVFGGMG